MKAFPLLLTAALSLAACQSPGLERFEFREAHMGTEFRLVFYASGPDVAGSAARAAFDRVAELDARLSDYREDSELNRLGEATRGGAIPCTVELSPDLARVLGRALELAERSDGAFDPTLGPYSRLWRRSARQAELPSAERLAEARSAAGWLKVELLPDGRVARLMAADMRFDLGGIAKGDALDQVLAVLRARGIDRALIDGGGDLLAGAAPPSRSGWRIGYQGMGSGRLELSNAALATSGDVYQHVLINGARYSHIIDPQTGLGLTRPTAANVLAPDGITADAVASAICVLGPERGIAWVERLPGVEARVVVAGADGELREERSSGFPSEG